MRQILPLILGLILLVPIHAQIPSTGLIKEYQFASGSLQNEINPGTSDLTATGSARTTIADLLGNQDDALQLNGDSFTGGVRGSSTVEERMEMSLSFWIKTTTNSSTEQIVFQQYGSSGFGPYGWMVRLVDGKIKLTVKALINGYIISPEVAAESTEIADGEWHHIVCRLDRAYFFSGGWTYGPQSVVYTDGVFSNSARSGGASSSGLIYMNPGSLPFSVAPDGNFQDGLDNIRVYNSTVSTSEVLELYKEFLASQSQVYVNQNATGLNNGLTWEDAFTDLNTALTYVSEQEIWLAAGTYKPDASDRSASFNIPANVSVYGGFNGTETTRSERNIFENLTILSGDLSGDDTAVEFTEATRSDNAYHVVEIDGNGTILDGLTIEGGQATGSGDDITGAGIFKKYSIAELTIRNCTIKNNVAAGGAGIYARFDSPGAGSVTIENCSIVNNLARHSTGYYSYTNYNTTGSSQTIDVDIVGSLFALNRAMDDATTLGYAGSSIAQRSYGYKSDVSLDIINCTFANNQDLGTNAAMSSSNRATIGVSQRTTGYLATISANIYNSIFWGNTEVAGATSKAVASFFDQAPTSLTASNSIDEDGFSAVAGANLTNVSSSDPLFADVDSEDFSLDCSSPAIDIGDESDLTLPATDIEGDDRILTTIDLGAFEFNKVFTAITAVSQDITVELDESGSAMIDTEDVDGGSGTTCGVEFTLSLDITSFDCTDIGENTVTLTATETGGASDVATATVTVVDRIAPTIVAQDITVDIGVSGSVTIATSDVDNGSSDNCTSDANLTFNLSESTFSCGDIGTHQVWLTVSDESGNTDSTSVNVTVRDEDAPVIDLQSLTIRLDETGTVQLTSIDVEASVSDVCEVTYSFSQSEFTCSDLGDNTVTLTTTDANGNESSSDITVTVEGYIEDQTVTTNNASFCVDGSSSTTVSIDGSQSGVNYYLRNSADNSVVDGPISGTGAGLDFSTGALSETTSFNVLGEIAISQPQALEFAGGNEYVAAGESTGFDYTQGYTVEAIIYGSFPTTSAHSILSYGTASVSDLEIYIQANTGYLTIVHGRVSGAAQSYYQYPQPSLYEWTHIAVAYDGGTEGVRVYYGGVEQTRAVTVNNGAFLQRDGAVLSIGRVLAFANSSDSFEGKMDEVRIWSSARTEEQIQQYKDVCLDGTENDLVSYFKFDESGTTAEDMVGGNDGVLTNMDPATDRIEGVVSCGVTCSLQMSNEVTIGDTEMPTVLAQDVTIYLDGNGNASITAVEIDNGSTDNCTSDQNLSLSLDQSSFTCSEVGEQTVTLTVEDESGNFSSATAVVTVVDETKPTAIAQNISVSLDADGNAEIVVADIDNGSFSVCGSDLTLALDITSFSCDDLGANTVQLFITDGNEQKDTATAVVTIVDDMAPSVVVQDVELVLDESGSATLTVADVDNGTTDNCTAVADLEFTLSETAFSCEDVGTSTVTLTATDASGNVSSTTINVTISDNENPTVIGTDISLILDENNQATISIDDVNAGSSDNCSITLSLSQTVFDTSHLGENSVTLTGVDPSGNSASATVTVTVSDKVLQEVTFTGVFDHVYGGENFTIDATTSSGLGVNYAVVSGGLSLVDSDGNTGTFAIQSAGEAVIQVTNDGDENHAPLSETITITIAKADQELTIETIENQSSQVTSVVVNASVNSGLDLEFAVSGPATIAGNVITLDGSLGTVLVTVSQSGDENYNPVSGSISFDVVEKSSQTISFSLPELVTYGTSGIALTATSSADLAVNFDVVSGPGTILEGTLIVNGVGQIVVEAFNNGDADFLGASVEQTLVVEKVTLTATADSHTISFGDVIPELTIDYAGFVNDEDVSALSDLPVASTTATSSSDAGIYAINITGGSATNYEIVLVNGILTINKALAGISISNLDFTVDGTSKTPQVSTDPAGLNFQITYDGSENPPSAIGQYLVEVVIDEVNFEGSASATMTISTVLGLTSVEVQVYPNPTTNHFKVVGQESLNVEVYDLSGQYQLSGKSNEPIDVSSLASGTYIIRVGEEGVYRLRKQ